MREDKTHTHLIVMSIITITSIGLVAESILMQWEFWMPPLLIAGLIIMWSMHIFQLTSPEIREDFYLGYAMAGTLFHGVHASSFFDVAIIVGMLLTTCALLGRPMMLNLILGEYIVIMGMQVYLIVTHPEVEFDPLNISRIALHVIVVILSYMVCRRHISIRGKLYRQIEKSEKSKVAFAKDVEDFLANISHELRTPVNVINGMSTLLLKDGYQKDIAAIYDAGLRLSRQIDDVQDYNEIAHDQIYLEEDPYMLTSLINDVIANLRMQENRKDLEFIVDLDPMVPTMLRGDIKKLHKIIRHLLDNAMKFTEKGGVYIYFSAVPRSYGVNLNIEVKDTGIGMSRKDLSRAATELYQANKKRDRSNGGIGLGLNIVYGFVHKMNGFVKIDSIPGVGTSVSVSIPQEVVDPMPSLRIENSQIGDILFHVRTDKYEVPEVREFYKAMAVHMAAGLKVNLYSAINQSEIRKLVRKLNVTHLFMGSDEYEENADYFEELCRKGYTVAVSALPDFTPREGSGVIIVPKPLYGFPLARVLNGDHTQIIREEEEEVGPILDGMRALVVDDEPMNLVVATGLFQEYHMIVDTAESGKESIEKFKNGTYDIIFMDHMMPEMDGMEAMKRLREVERQQHKAVRIVALTANALSGTRELFLREGFDGFISKPIDIREFERTMLKVFPKKIQDHTGGEA